MVNGFSSPSSNIVPQPLERLNVYDGLMMNAARWDVSQIYMRQRQNLHFQAMNQGGIVTGLGVKVIDPPAGVSQSIQTQDQKRKEKRWLEIQPGVAIDAVGNPIIVGPGQPGRGNQKDGKQEDGNKRDRSFRLAISPLLSGTLTVYVVATYVEPGSRNGDRSQHDTIPEQFRFDLITTPPGELEVELCRIELPPGPLQLKMPANLLAPTVGELDLTHRVMIQAKPQAIVRLGVVGAFPNETRHQFQGLAQSMTTLYPNLQLQVLPEAIKPTLLTSGQIASGQNPRQPPPPSVMRSNDRSSAPAASSLSPRSQPYDLLYIEGQNVDKLMPKYRSWLDAFVRGGGVVLLKTKTTKPLHPQFLQLFGELTLWADCPPLHWLRTQPFFFTHLPELAGEQIHIATAPGLVWVSGGLCQAWGVSHSLPRHDIRTAHELGINLMHYVWRQRHLRCLSHW